MEVKFPLIIIKTIWRENGFKKMVGRYSDVHSSNLPKQVKNSLHQKRNVSSTTPFGCFKE